MNTRLVNNLPFEMKLNILKYYPIVEKRREHINIGIRNIYKIKKLITVYSIYHYNMPYEQELFKKNYFDELSASWVYSDLCFFLNNFIPLRYKISDLLLEFFSRLPYPYNEIDSLVKLSFLEDKYYSDKYLLILFASYMNENEMKYFMDYIDNIYNMSYITKNIDIFNK
uniref:Uncharacterized protein n=1 Tax=viral metagenome TaxID=1070528 RepID=A0A6C0AG21_9ZZZZ|tara:strand:- start:4211 stop:4717 length:507 start_codon:yes stop_codon:yes gene_type:complete